MWQRYFNDIRTRLSHWWRVLELESLGQLTRKTTRVVARRLRTRLKRVRHSRSLESATCSRGVESLEQRQVLSGSKFDFGTGSSPVELGFTRAPVVAYTAARGWGWSTTAGIGAINRGVGNANSPAMTRDFHYGRNNTFRVNVANGTYDIVVQLGDASARRDQINVDIEGTRVVTGIDTSRGQFFRATYRTSVLDGELTVRLTDTGGVNPYWTFDGLEIHPLATSETLATVGLTSGWATFGQALPQGAAFDALQIGSLPTQTDIKTRWPDGSIRFAVLTTEVDADGSYPIKPAFAATGHVELGQLPAEVRLTTELLDQPSVTAAIPSAIAPDSMWLDGSQVREGRWSVVPTDTNGQSLSGLRVLFDQRTYRNGARRLEVTIENSDDTADNQLRNLAVQIWTDADHNGLLDELLFDRHDLAMGSGTRFVQRFNWDLNSSAVTPDLEPVFASGALPRYAAGVSDVIGSAFDENGQLRPEFDLLGPGDLNPYMGSGGGRSDIGPYTEWTARYLAHQHAQQADYLLRLGDLAGSWPIHLREPTDGHLVSLTERPNFWFDDRGRGPHAQRAVGRLASLARQRTCARRIVAHPVLAHRRSVLRGRAGLLGQLRRAVNVAGQLRDRCGQSIGWRCGCGFWSRHPRDESSARLRLGFAKHLRCRRVSARQRRDADSAATYRHRELVVARQLDEVQDRAAQDGVASRLRH